MDPISPEITADVPRSPLNGVPVPVAHQFKPGNPGGPGRPRGADPRYALARALAKNADAEGIGAKSEELAQQMLAAMAAGDDKAVKACALVIAEVQGRPQERVEHSGELTYKRVVLEGDAP